MAYRVELTLRAKRDLSHLYTHINAGESQAAVRWFNGLEEAVYSLELLPRRWPIARLGKMPHRSIRQLLYGDKPHVYRVIYEIDEQHKTVYVLTIRHGARDEVRSRDLFRHS